MKPTDEEDAIAILGKERVITASLAAKHWGWSMSNLPENPLIPYSLKTLKRCRKSNMKGKTDWRLVYIRGFSFNDQIALRGTNPMRPPYFRKKGSIWGQSDAPGETSWRNKKKALLPGYHLLDFKIRYLNINREYQDKYIQRLGKRYERADERSVSEAVFTIYMSTGEYLLKDVRHWGWLNDKDGWCIAIGKNSSEGLLVDSEWVSCSGNPLVGVVLWRKPDIKPKPSSRNR